MRIPSIGMRVVLKGTNQRGKVLLNGLVHWPNHKMLFKANPYRACDEQRD